MPSPIARSLPVAADRRAFQDVEAAARFCTFRLTGIGAGGRRVSHDGRPVSHANLPGQSTLDLASENSQALAHAPMFASVTPLNADLTTSGTSGASASSCPADPPSPSGWRRHPSRLAPVGMGDTPDAGHEQRLAIVDAPGSCALEPGACGAIGAQRAEMLREGRERRQAPEQDRLGVTHGRPVRAEEREAAAFGDREPARGDGVQVLVRGAGLHGRDLLHARHAAHAALDQLGTRRTERGGLQDAVEASRAVLGRPFHQRLSAGSWPEARVYWRSRISAQ